MLPRRNRGIEKGACNPVARDAFRLYTGMRRAAVFGLEWTRIDLSAMRLRVGDTKTDEPPEFPIARQLAAILECRLADRIEKLIRAGEPGF